MEQYLGMMHVSLCVQNCVFNDKLQIGALDVTKFSSHDPQVGHSLWGLLTLQIFYQFVEITNNFCH